MSFANQTIRASGWQLLTMGVQFILHYGALFFMARFVEPEKWGAVTVAMIVINLAQSISDAGLGPALIQRRDITMLHKRVALTTSVMIGVALMLAVFAAAEPLSRFYELPELRQMLFYIAFAFVLQSFGLISKSLLRRELKFQTIMWIETAACAIAYAAVGIVLSLLGYGIWAIIMATLSYNAFGSITYFLAARHSLRPSLDGQTVRELLFFGGGLTLSRLLQFAATNIDKLILAKVLGHQLLGVYDMAYRVMMLPAKNFGNVIDNVMFPTLANVQHQLPLMRKAFLGVISVISLFYLPLTAFVIVIAEELTLALLGEKWVSIILPLRLLMASSYFRITVRMCDATIRALGAVYQDAVRKLLFLLAITVGVWAGGSAGSINGACIGLGIADAVTYAMMSILCCNLLNLKISQFLIQNLSGLFLATVSGGTAFAALALLGTMSSPPLLSLIIVTATTALTLSALTWVRPDLLGPSGMLLVQRCLNLVKIRHWVFTALREKFAAPINQDTLAS